RVRLAPPVDSTQGGRRDLLARHAEPLRDGTGERPELVGAGQPQQALDDLLIAAWHRAADVSQHGVDAATTGLGGDVRLLQLLAPLPDPTLDLLAVLLAEPADVVDLERWDSQQLADGGDVETRDRRQGTRAEAGLLDGRLGRDRGSGGVIAYGGGAVVVEILEDREPGGHQLIDVAVAVLGLRRESLAEEQRQGGRNDRLEAVRGDDRRVARARGTRPTALPPDLVAGGHLEQRGRDGPQLGG